MSRETAFCASRIVNPSESLLPELEAFGIPFICFGDNWRVTVVSLAARALLNRFDAPADLIVALGRAVASALSEAVPCEGAGLFPLVTELTTLGVCERIAIHRPLRPDPLLRAVAVLSLRNSAWQAPAMNTLTKRERDVAALLGRGAQTKEVAVRLGISPHTVRRHTEKVFSKLNVRNRASLARLVAG